MLRKANERCSIDLTYIAMSLYMIVNLFSLALIQVRGGEATPIAGQHYTLMCDSSWANIGAYQWRKDGTVLSSQSL